MQGHYASPGQTNSIWHVSLLSTVNIPGNSWWQLIRCTSNLHKDTVSIWCCQTQVIFTEGHYVHLLSHNYHHHHLHYTLIERGAHDHHQQQAIEYLSSCVILQGMHTHIHATLIATTQVTNEQLFFVLSKKLIMNATVNIKNKRCKFKLIKKKRKYDHFNLINLKY